jgi:PKD repeat protein
MIHRKYQLIMRSLIVVTILVSASLFHLPTGVLLSEAQPLSAFPIRLGGTTFTPALGERPDVPPGLMIGGYASQHRGYYIVQFQGPVEQRWKEKVTEIGAELLDYIPEFAFKVRMNPGQARKVESLDFVIWIGLFHPAYKLSGDLLRDGTHIYTVRIERGVQAGLAVASIKTTGAQILAREGDVLTVAADSFQVDAIAHVLDVAWIQNFMLRQKHNEYGAGSIMGSTMANELGYDGSTQTVAISDTGLGGGTPSTAHVDLPASRIAAIYNWPGFSELGLYTVLDDGAKDVDSGHGTHVTLSVIGDGGPYGEGRGTAPEASLIFQALENYIEWGIWGLLLGYEDGYYLAGIPADIRELFQQTYSAGARIQSNSWGSDAASAYTLDSSNVDEFVWSHGDMTIAFSAGNAGIDTNSDGLIDSYSMGSPGTAKNVITVGASENDREANYPCDPELGYTNCASQGGQNDIFTYGEAWPSDYPAEPLWSDPAAGNAEQMAAFSSRGPTNDKRIKPDVVAPGTWVLSGYSDMFQQGYDPSPNPQNGLWQYDGWGFPLDSYYKFMGGTSMACPLLAGAAAVVRDFYQKADSHSASAALVKATLINSAVDLLDENNDGINDNDFPIPNVHEGWGRVDLMNAVDDSHQYIDEINGLNTNATATYTFIVGAGSDPLKVTLVWSDYPSTETASKNLVNDLDLLVTSPSGVFYKGNIFAGGWSQSGGTADRINNVENVYIPAAEEGTWIVEVYGYNVPYGPQPFALVVDAGLSSSDNQPPTASFTYTATGLTVDFDASGSSDLDGTIDDYAWDFGDGTSGSGETTNHTYTAAGTYTATLTVTDDDGATDTTSQYITVTAPTQIEIHVGDLDGSSISVGKKKWKATATVIIHDSNENKVENVTVNISWDMDGQTKIDSAITDGMGQCSFTSTPILNTVNSVTFKVDSLTSATMPYNQSENYKTSITVGKPYAQ